DGFFEEVHGADARGFDGGIDGGVAAHHDDGHVQQPLRAPFLEQADPVGVGHPDVEQHQIGAGALPRRARLRRIFGQFDRVPLVVKDFGQKLANTDFVVNHQNSGHKPSTYCVAALSFSCAGASIATARDASRVSSIETRAPPSLRLARSILPPCSSTILRTMANPNPVPWALVVTYGSKALCMTF